MKPSRPGILSVRAVNQYRRRDILTYLSLRYYLANTAARTDQWAREVATHLVLTRSEQPYLRALHFKEITNRGKVEHRQIFLPGANEALAEAALLDECAKHSDVFSNPDSVFSYQLCTGEDRSGVFQPYFGGLQRRHRAIAEACDACPDGEVLYIDIKRFYPSINKELAVDAWKNRAETAGLHGKWSNLGELLLQEHARVDTGDESCVLTGPMFSHLIGNLVLRNLDEECSKNLPAAYFRYVDDFTLVGNVDAVNRSLNIIRERLDNLGFALHDESSPKTIRVSAQEWLKGQNDFHDSRQVVSWKTLIGDLKNFLLQNPAEHKVLHNAFLEEGFRIPVRDYSGVVYEASYLDWAYHWAKKTWFRKKSQAITIDALLAQARHLQKKYEQEFLESIDGAERLESFNRKRRIPKLRYLTGRLIYLASDESMQILSSAAGELPELRFHAEVMKAVFTGNIDCLLSMGTNAAQAAAQPMRAAEKHATFSLQRLSKENEQTLAIFVLNGINIKGLAKITRGEHSEFTQFARGGTDVNLMKHAQPFMRELMCLHGLSDHPRHPQMLKSVYDVDESLTMDAIEQLQQSIST